MTCMAPFSRDSKAPLGCTGRGSTSVTSRSPRLACRSVADSDQTAHDRDSPMLLTARRTRPTVMPDAHADLANPLPSDRQSRGSPSKIHDTSGHPPGSGLPSAESAVGGADVEGGWGG